MPDRIQLRRTGGWQKPPGAVAVTRPGKWGNPFVVLRDVNEAARRRKVKDLMWGVYYRGQMLVRWDTKELATLDAVGRYRQLLFESPAMAAEARAELAGKDLGCWCKPGDPCHADALMLFANATTCLECGPGYRYGDDGCRHTPAPAGETRG